MNDSVVYYEYMKIIEKVSLVELVELAEKMYGTLVKADVDVAKIL